MNCRKARSLLSLRLDGCISYGEERRLSQHLESCASCSSEYSGLEQTVRAVRDLPEIPPRESFVEEVLEAVRYADQVPSLPRVGLLDRMRIGVARLVSSPSPRFAAAALCLGLVVGIAGSMLAFRAPSGGVSTATTVTGGTSVVQTAEGQNRIDSEDTPLPSGPFDDLVEEMLLRLESEPSDAEQPSPEAPAIDWGSAVEVDAYGRQVTTGGQSGRGFDPKARITVAY